MALKIYEKPIEPFLTLSTYKSYIFKEKKARNTYAFKKFNATQKGVLNPKYKKK